MNSGGRSWHAALLLAVIGVNLGACADPEGLPGQNTASDGGGGSSGTNAAPTASFTINCSALDCNFDGTASTDRDGSIASFSWDFGDGASASGATVAHTYAADGDFAITLTVTDDNGATGTRSQTTTVAASGVGNNPPSASFSTSCTDLGCIFDGSASSDSDGSITSYSWDFGDGAVGTGATANHSYAAYGDYTVMLTVTDNVAASSSATQTVTVLAPAGNLDGHALYDQNCAACHGADATGGTIARISIVGATAQDIQNAINTVPNMSSLAGLPAGQIQAIADFLATLITGTSVTKLGYTFSKITIVDADGTVATTESDPISGGYMIDGSGLNGSLLAKAEFPMDGSVLYGFASSTGVLNITPLTTRVIRILLGDSLNDCVDGSSCDGVLTPEAVDFAQTLLAVEMADEFQTYGIGSGSQWINKAFDYQYSNVKGMSALIDSLPLDSRP